MPHCLLPPGAVAAGPVTAAGSRSAVRIFSQTSHCPAIPDARSANELKQLFTYLTLFVSLNQSCFQEILLCIPGLHTRTAYREHTGISCRGIPAFMPGAFRDGPGLVKRRHSTCPVGAGTSSGIKNRAAPLEKGISRVPKTPDTRSPACKVPVPSDAETGNAPVTYRVVFPVQ